MSIMLFAAAAAVHMPATLDGLDHRTEVQHQGAAVELVYRGRAMIRSKQVGAASSTRVSAVRCAWRVHVAVDRTMGGSTRTVATDEILSGSRPGDCLANRRAIGEDVAARGEAVRAHVAAVAGRDRPQALAELEAARRIASRD